MDLLKMLEELRTEREHIDEAILVMERLAIGTGGKRRGRPPTWMSAQRVGVVTSHESEPKVRKKRNFSPEQREAARVRMKTMWAKRKKASA